MKGLGIRGALLMAGCLTLAGVLSMLTPKRSFVQTSWPTRLLTALFGDNGPALAMLLMALALCVFALVTWVTTSPARTARKP